MLETPEERTKLLRAGFASKEIERLYIESNGFKIVNIPAFMELVEVDIKQNKKTCISCEVHRSIQLKTYVQPRHHIHHISRQLVPLKYPLSKPAR